MAVYRVHERLNKMKGVNGTIQSITIEDQDVLPVGSKRRRSSRLSTDSPVDFQEALRDRDSRIEDLEDINATLRRELQLEKQKRKQNIFRVEYVPTRKNGSGGAKTYSPQLRAITIDLLSNGVTGNDIVRMFHAIAVHGDMLDDDCDVPRPDWVRKIKSTKFYHLKVRKQREELEVLSNKQAIAFVQQSQYVTLGWDQTSLHNEKPGCFGLTDNHGEFHALCSEITLSRNAEELATEMMSFLDGLTAKDSNGVTLGTLIRRKAVALMTDRARLVMIFLKTIKLR